MKMQHVYIEFEKKIAVTVYVPEDTTAEQIEDIAKELAAEGLRDWDDPEWEPYVGVPYAEEIPDERLKRGPPNTYGYRPCLVEEFTEGDGALVLSDDKTDFVQPEDATWWIGVDLADPETEGA